MNRCDSGLDIVMVHTDINTGGENMEQTDNRISLDSMEAKIVSEEYIQPTNIPHMTIAVLVVENGFALVGKSAPADPDNYDEELGRKFAKEEALRQLWQLEGYLLRERMML